MRGRNKFGSLKKHDVQSNPDRAHDASKTHKRDGATIRRLNMYTAKPHRDKNGKILSGQYVSKEVEPGAGRIEADRRWFGNTRVVGQTELETFRTELQETHNNPYKLILGQKKLYVAFSPPPLLFSLVP